MHLQRIGYHLGKRIGEGSYSKVYYAEHQNAQQPKSFSNQPIACKIIDGRYTSVEFLEKFLPRELSIVQNLAHPNIVSVYSILEMGPFVCFFMDFCPFGDLLDRIRYHGALSERRSRLYFAQICNAVEYLHASGITHRDIKCENILIHSRYCVKLTDFGFSRRLYQEKYKKNVRIDDVSGGSSGRSDWDGLTPEWFSRTYCGSAAYAAPEVLKGIAYDPRLYDMWSLGCVLFIMVTGVMPFDDANISATIQKQEEHNIVYPENVSVPTKVRTIISGLLEPIVWKRTTIDKLMYESWVRCSQ